MLLVIIYENASVCGSYLHKPRTKKETIFCEEQRHQYTTPNTHRRD